MWLLNTTTLELEQFLGKDVPPYAILSHTWGKDESTFQELQAGYMKESAGFTKLRRFCALAKDHQFNYAWMDTCCIDKTSSAELSESINSMYRWYEMSAVCYAYLEDVPDDDNPIDEDSKFRRSRWFTRGWTLQELIAPSNMYFYSANWEILGGKSKTGQHTRDANYRERPGLCWHSGLSELLSSITGISIEVLEFSWNLPDCSIAQRMSWAASRQTTRPEDIAYCLMGLFDINMPLLYGEGEEKAFIRLQEEILRFTEDDTLLMHICPENQCYHETHPVLAKSPKGFRGLGNVERGEKGPLFHGRNIMSRMTPKGLQVQLPIFPCTHLEGKFARDAYIAILDSSIPGSHLSRGVIVLEKLRDGIFVQMANSSLAQLDSEKQEVVLKTKDLNTTTKAIFIKTNNVQLETMYISNSNELATSFFWTEFFRFRCTNVMFQPIEQPAGDCVTIQADTSCMIRNWRLLAKKHKICLLVDKAKGDVFAIVLGAYIKFSYHQGVSQSEPYCRIFMKEPDQTLEDIKMQEMGEQLYPDERLKGTQEQDGLDEPQLSPLPSSQSAILELSGSRTAVVTVDRKEFLDREEYRFKLTIKEKT